MKKITLIFSMLIFLSAFAIGQKILVLDEPCIEFDTPYLEALTSLAYTFDETNIGAFATDILSDNYDLVIFSVYNSSVSNDNWDALNTYLTGGGRIIVSTWSYNFSHVLFENMGVELIDLYAEPMNLYQWSEGHLLFSTPNTISNSLIYELNPCNTDGARGNALLGATAVAGLNNGTAIDDYAAVIVNSTESSIFMGQVPYVWYNATIVPFLENQIEFLLRDYVGINMLSEFGIEIYPNPFSGKFTIKNANDFDVKISDISGKMLKQFSINDEEYTIDMTKHANGIYFIQFINNDIVKTVKIIKN